MFGGLQGVDMPGTKVGGVKAAETNKARYGDDFYKVIGSEGGKKSMGGGFARDPELAKVAGAKGGRKSRKPITIQSEEVARKWWQRRKRT